MKKLFLILLFSICSVSVASEFFGQKTQHWNAPDFTFHTGESFKELKIGYTTLGNPTNPAILILHGTAGSGERMLDKDFGGELFGPGQALDATKFFIILPDSIGAGKSSKPSDNLRAKFPKYNYDYMVLAQYRLVTEGLKISHLRMVLGNSMGGMHTWLWGIQHPGFMDILVPMASLPIEMSGRNWIMRRFFIDSIKNDPEWMEGNYTKQPSSFHFAYTYYSIATNGGTQAIQKQTPTSEIANQYIKNRMSAPFDADANDYLYQFESSSDYNPTGQLDKIKARLLVINSADDERNPTELNAITPVLNKIAYSRLFLIPASDQTSGHGTTYKAKWWKDQVQEIINSAPILTNTSNLR